jgi:sulfatase maturation enzyme AslB (radical SAM superfamily)
MKNKTANTVYSQLLYGNNKHISAIIVNIIDICNYNCYYCYNKKPRTNKILDLHALIHFIDWFSNNINSNIILFILGGEPTLHPQLFDFCVFLRKKYKNINCRIVTNFSYDIKKILTLLEYGI